MNVDGLVIDIWVGDGNVADKLPALAVAGRPWCGAIAKACEGQREDGAFARNWPAIKTAGGPRYSIDWFRGAYALLDATDAVDQAHAYLDTVNSAGGWDVGDLWPILDVERTRYTVNMTRASVEQTMRTWAMIITRETGRAPMLYGGSWIRGFGIQERLGFQLLWIPRYAATLPEDSYQAIGWDLSRVWGWQYVGVPRKPTDPAPAGYPTTTPIGDLDITAIIVDGGPDQQRGIDWTRVRLGSNPQ